MELGAGSLGVATLLVMFMGLEVGINFGSRIKEVDASVDATSGCHVEAAVNPPTFTLRFNNIIFHMDAH